MVEGLSNLLGEAKKRGEFQGYLVTRMLAITYLLFVDDILIFSNGSLQEVALLKSILTTFGKASSTIINFKKYSLLVSNLGVVELQIIFIDGPSMTRCRFKILGFHLKPNTSQDHLVRLIWFD